MAKAKARRKGTILTPNVNSEPIAADTTPRTLPEVLAAILAEVPKAARRMVEDASNAIREKLRGRAHDTFTIGELAAKVQDSISKASFARWMNEYLVRVGASRTSLYRWMDEARKTSSLVPNETARVALAVITDGRGLFSRADGELEITGTFAKALKAFPVPDNGTSYEDCLDWARSIQVVIESGGRGKRTAGEVLKGATNAFTRILRGGKGITANHKMAVQHVVNLFALLYSESVPLADGAKDGIELVMGGMASDPAQQKAWETAQSNVSTAKAQQQTKAKATA